MSKIDADQLDAQVEQDLAIIEEREPVIVPHKGYFEDPHAMLAAVMENKNIEQLVIITFEADGNPKYAHYNMSQERLAWCGAYLSRIAIDPDFDA